MTAPNLARRRRVLRIALLCAATALLHVAAIGWVGAHVGAQSMSLPPAPPPAMVVQLHLAAPAVQAGRAAAAPPAPAVAVHPKTPRKRAPPLQLAAAEPAPPSAQVAPSPAPATEAAAAAPSVSPAHAAPAAAQAEPLPAAIPAVPASDKPQPEPAEKPHFKFSAPPSAELALDVERADADGTQWHGVGAMQWQSAGGAYKITVTAGISLLVTRVNLITSTSEGGFDADGIAPLLATEQRRGRAATATHFNRQDGRITFSASERSYPLLAGAQDKASLPFQLAGIGRADPAQLAADIDILIGEDKEANVFHFVLVGQEEIDSKLGKLQTWHLSRPPRPGSYNSRLDIWLAPAQGWYPVQIRNTEASGAVTTQSVSRIALSEAGSAP
ncbi:MAG: DUF3108 domain-containing protein [Pseudomonadota bacterium]